MRDNITGQNIREDGVYTPYGLEREFLKWHEANADKDGLNGKLNFLYALERAIKSNQASRCGLAIIDQSIKDEKTKKSLATTQFLPTDEFKGIVIGALTVIDADIELKGAVFIADSWIRSGVSQARISGGAVILDSTIRGGVINGGVINNSDLSQVFAEGSTIEQSTLWESRFKKATLHNIDGSTGLANPEYSGELASANLSYAGNQIFAVPKPQKS